MSKTQKKSINLKLLWRTLKYATPFKGTLLITLSITFATAFLAPFRTLLIGKAIDEHIQENDLPGLNNVILLLLGLLLLHTFLQFFQAYLTGWLGQSIILSIRKKVFRHITCFKLKYFDTHPIGALVTRVTSDIQSIAEIFSQGIISIMSDILQLTVALIFMFSINWKLSIVVLLPIPILVYATIFFKNFIQEGFIQVRKNVSKINTFVQEHVTGMYVVQIFNRENEEFKKFKSVNKAHRDGWIKTVWANAVFFPAVEILSAISLALLIWWGANGVMKGESSVGEIMAFILFVHMLYRPIRQLADKFNTLQMGMVASERVFKILDTDEHIPNDGEIKDVKIKGLIEFENVSFAYSKEDYVLREVSFLIKPGQSLALVGATGSGKSSIINVLTRFYEYQKGNVKVDGIVIEKYQLEFLRKVSAVVLQDVFLFNDSILNNITLNNEDISFERVEEAAKLIGAHQFISSLPGGYDYVVKERGVMLSSGQKQLLAFLRAYLYNPSILILDEATSSIDTTTEMLIQNAISKITEGRTSIIIAHRLSTIQDADNIIVMDDGKIAEQGTHEELLSLNGLYRDLYNHQLED
ncbi:MAG: ATP-binding cassette subfamily B multidrug efflux pump, partial [Saprospiraceae bacterium]